MHLDCNTNTPGVDPERRAVDFNRPVTSLVRSWCAAGRAGTNSYRGIDIQCSPCPLSCGDVENFNAIGRQPAGKRRCDIICRAGCESAAPNPLCGIAVESCGACQVLSAAASRLQVEVRGTPSESASGQTNRLSAAVAALIVLPSPPPAVPVLEG